MKLGMPSLVEFNSIEENIIFCHALGLAFVEINMNMGYCLPNINDIQHINQLLNKYNIELTMHFPEEIDFGTPYKVISEANIQLFEEYCDYAQKMSIKKINVHLLPGAYITLPHTKMYSYEKDLNEFFHNLMHSFKRVSKIASTYNIEVCVENTKTPPFLLRAIEMLAQLENICFTYDIGHDALNLYNVEKIFKKLEKKVNHMHFHDYDGKTDHQVLFKGQIDLIDRLNLAKKHNMSVVIEVKTKEALIESVNELKKRNLI